MAASGSCAVRTPECEDWLAAEGASIQDRPLPVPAKHRHGALWLLLSAANGKIKKKISGLFIEQVISAENSVIY